jgi:hypothetical protein
MRNRPQGQGSAAAQKNGGESGYHSPWGAADKQHLIVPDGNSKLPWEHGPKSATGYYFANFPTFLSREILFGEIGERVACHRFQKRSGSMP